MKEILKSKDCSNIHETFPTTITNNFQENVMFIKTKEKCAEFKEMRANEYYLMNKKFLRGKKLKREGRREISKNKIPPEQKKGILMRKEKTNKKIN